MTVGELISTLVEDGLEYFGLYYSCYEGQVTDNKDPKKRGRLKVVCPAVYGEQESDWAMSKGMFSGKNIGFFALPQKGDPVWITFRRGDPKQPLWEYGAYATGYIPEGADFEHFTLRTPAGYLLQINEKDKSFSLTTPGGLLLNLNEKDKAILLKRGDNDYIRIKQKISIYANGENLFAQLDKDMETLIKPQNIITPNGPGQFNPDAVANFTKIKVALNKLLE